MVDDGQADKRTNTHESNTRRLPSMTRHCTTNSGPCSSSTTTSSTPAIADTHVPVSACIHQRSATVVRLHRPPLPHLGQRDPRRAPQRGKGARSLHVRSLSHTPLLACLADRDHSKGNKSTLIARIREHEENTVTSSPVRNASTNVAPPKTVSQVVLPGIPLAMQPNSASTKSDFLVVKLPNLSQHPPIAPVQVVSFVHFFLALLRH